MIKDNERTPPELKISNKRMAIRNLPERQQELGPEGRLQQSLQQQNENQMELQSKNQVPCLSDRLVVFGGANTSSASLIEILSTDGKHWIPVERKSLKNSIRAHLRFAMLDAENIVLTGSLIRTNRVSSFEFFLILTEF